MNNKIHENDLRDPFLALYNVLRITKETVIITLPHPSSYFSADFFPPDNLEKPLMVFMPEYREVQNPDMCTWWAFTPETIKRFINILGFRECSISTHYQKFQNTQQLLYTIVGHRK